MHKTFRPDVIPCFLFGGMSGLPLFLYLFAYLSEGWHKGLSWDPRVAMNLVIFLTIFVIAIALLYNYKITITDTDLKLNSLFRRQKSIRLADIKVVKLLWQFEPNKGPFRLIVEPKNELENALDINAKFFSKEAVVTILALGEKYGKADDSGLLDGVVMRSLRKAQGGKLSKTAELLNKLQNTPIMTLIKKNF